MANYYNNRRGSRSTLVEEIKSKVSIPLYVDKVIMPMRESYYAGTYHDPDLLGPIKCPLHDEDTASFRYRPDVGTFKCFGCGAYGDVIELHQKFYEVEFGRRIPFDEAVLFLKKTFIDKDIVVDVEEIIEPERVIDIQERTYLNALYARVFDMIVCNKETTAEQKKRALWEIRSLREMAYAEPAKYCEKATEELNKYIDSMLSA